MSRLHKRRPQCVASEEESAAAIQQQQKQQQMAIIPFNIQRATENENNNQQQQLGLTTFRSQPSQFNIGEQNLQQNPFTNCYFTSSTIPNNNRYNTQSQQQQQLFSNDWIFNNNQINYLPQQQSSIQLNSINSSIPSSSSINNQQMILNYYPMQMNCQGISLEEFKQEQQQINSLQKEENNNVIKTEGADDILQYGINNSIPIFLQSRSPFETFCTVPGRTSLLSSTTKHKVTVGEIQRRINPPECLNASLIGGILRKAKSKDGGKALRESLKRIGLSLPAGRRKSTCVTAFTALVEEEALHLANDFRIVLQREFPIRDSALYLNNRFMQFSNQTNDNELINRRRTMLSFARMFVKELSELMSADRSPIVDRRPELILDSCIQKRLTHFSLITHGFGGIAILAVLEAVNDCINESLKSLEKMLQNNTQNQTTDMTNENNGGINLLFNHQNNQII